jgi:CarD family transcriptional regulator
MTALTIKNAPFQIGDIVVYPTHGVGLIEAEEETEVAGNKMSFFVVATIKNKVTIRVPKTRAEKAGLRHLSPLKDLDEALTVLKQSPKKKRGNWPKIAQDYNNKINSGEPKLIAAVARDCYEGTSYSEQTLCEQAIDRLATEYALAKGVDEQEAKELIIKILRYRIK